MAIFPGAVPPAGSAVSTATLAAAGHTALHNTEYDEIRALATKLGTGSSTATSGTVLRGTGAGTSAWGQAVLTTDVTGTLPVANGGTGSTNLTFPTGPDTLVARNSTDTLTNKTLTTPTIANFTNADHDHSNAAGGGQLNGANSIVDGTITPAKLVSGSGSSWAWSSFTPTITPFSGSFTTVSASGQFTQIGKTILYKVTVTITTVGTAGGYCQFTLPVTASASSGVSGTSIGSGRAGAVSGKGLSVISGDTTTGRIYNYDNTSPSASGEVLYISGEYEAS